MNERHIPVPAGWDIFNMHILSGLGEKFQLVFKCNTFLRWFGEGFRVRAQRREFTIPDPKGCPWPLFDPNNNAVMVWHADRSLRKTHPFQWELSKTRFQSSETGLLFFFM
jgi:hypothetical protein